MDHNTEAEEWKIKAQRAEEKAMTQSNIRDAETWREIARIYRELAARREAWPGIGSHGPRCGRLI